MSGRNDTSETGSETEDDESSQFSKEGGSRKSTSSSDSESLGNSGGSSDDSTERGSTVEVVEIAYSLTLGKMSARQKIKRMDSEISMLRHQLDYFKMMNDMNKEGTTKKGRRLLHVSNNSSIMTSIRDVMAEIVFPHCKFIGKVDLQSTGEGSIADVLMKHLKVGKHLKDNRHQYMKHRLEWWGCNCELVEKCLVDHKTTTTQSLKKRYLSGKRLSFM